MLFIFVFGKYSCCLSMIGFLYAFSSYLLCNVCRLIPHLQFTATSSCSTQAYFFSLGFSLTTAVCSLVLCHHMHFAAKSSSDGGAVSALSQSYVYAAWSGPVGLHEPPTHDCHYVLRRPIFIFSFLPS